MATMDVTTELRLTELRKRNLRKTFDHIEAQSSSVLFLSLQWKDMEEHFDSIAKSISQRNNELTSLEESIVKRFDEIQSREQGVESVQESVNQRFKELELREKSFEKKERLVFEEQSKELNLLRVSVENQSREVQIVRRVVEEEVKALELKEERFVILQKSVEEESKNIEVVQNSIFRSFRDLKLKERHLCLMEKSVEDRGKDNDLKERVIEMCSKELELNEKRLEDRAKGVELKEEKFEEHEKAFALKEKRLEEHEKAFSLKNKRLEECAVEIELKGKRFEERAKEVELKEKSFEGRLKAFDLKEKELEERLVEIELEGKRFEERAKEVELKEKSFEGRLKAFDLKEKELEERLVEIELEGNRFEERAKEVELKEKRFERRSKAFDWKEKRLEECSVEIELKGKRFEERAKAVELKEKRFEEHEKAFALKENRLEERSAETELKGKRFEELAKEAELKEMRFEEHEKAFALKEKRLEECDIEIELKTKRLEERSREIELKEKRLEECSREIELKERRLEECSREIELKVKRLEERYREVELKGKESEQCSLDIEAKDQGFTENAVGDNAIEVYAPKHARLCVIMDGNSLQKFLNKHWEEHDLMHDEVLYALREASEPAKIVLDAMQGFYPLNADNGNTSIELSVVRKSCILLLEQLIRVSPEITPIVKEEAMKLAFDWMTKMSPKAENHMECLGFLLLLAAYGLVSAFDEGKLVSQLVVVARDRQAPVLCRLLGLAPDKISDFIRILIARKQHLDAIRLVYAFKLVGEFEPVYLLKQYIIVYEVAARKVCRMKNDSPAAQIEFFNKRVADLKAVIQCIEDHNLESEFLPKNLECSITELEKKKANIIKTFPSSVPNPQPQQHCEKTCIIVAPHVSLLTTAPTTDPTPNMQEGQESGNKRLRTALSATDALNASRGATSSNYSLPFPNLKPSGIHTGQDIKQTTLVKLRKNNTKKQSWNLPLKPHRRAAMKLARHLKVKLDKKIERREDVMNFLNHLATYELSPSFDPDELLVLFGYVYRRKNAPDLCRDLGLADKIPQIIQNLIEKEEWLEAFRYVYAFGLHDRFPPVTLLKDYLSHSKKVADKKLEDGKNSLEAQICSVRKEISASRCVLSRIANFKLESEYPPKILKDRIVQLEKQSEDILKVLNSTGRGDPVTRSNTEKKYTASTTVTPIPAAQPLQQSGRKRRRAIAAHPNLHSKFGAQDSTGHYFSAGFPSINRRTDPYPFSYYPRPGYYHGQPAAPCGGPCDALNGPCGCRGPSYHDEQAHYGSNGLPPQCHSSLYP